MEKVYKSVLFGTISPFKFIILYFMVFFLAGCGGVVPDNGTVLPAIRAGVPTVELHGCGGIDKGLKICTVGRETNLTSLNLSIQGYWEGRVSYVTSGCPVELDDSLLYSRHQKIRIPVSGLLERDCLVTVTLSPRYRGFENNGVIVWPIEGHIYLRRTSRLPTTQTNITARDVSFFVPATETRRIVMESSLCDISFDEDLEPQNNGIEIRLSDLTAIDERKLCIINGANVEDRSLLLWYVAIHDPNYSFLPKPALETKRRRLKVKGTSDVTAIILNDDYKYGSEGSFRFDRKKQNILRMVTAKGRSVLAIWNPRTESWSWK